MLHIFLTQTDHCSEIQWYTNAKFGEGHGTPNMSYWNCIGNESSLADCLHQNSSKCNHSQDVGISCKGLEVKGLIALYHMNPYQA